MSGSDWYISDRSGRAIAALAAGESTDTRVLASPEGNHLVYRHGLVVPAARLLDPASHRGRYMAAVAARMTARQVRIDSHLQRILQRFAEARVPVAVVKGPAVAREYRDPSVRTYTDVDLVIPARDLERALSSLASYEAIGAIPAKVPAADKRDIVVRDRSGVQFTVDLHWDLFSFSQLRGSAASAMAHAWQQATFQPDHDLGPVWLLPEPTVISFLSLHALLDHRFRLILFRDLLEIARNGTDWANLAQFSEAHGLTVFNYLAWLIAANVVGAEVPDEFLRSMRRDYLAERLSERYLKRTDLVRFDGHRAHPLNLALTLVHDSAAHRRRLVARAPVAYPRWRKRVRVGPLRGSNKLDVVVTSNARRGAEVFGRTLADELLLRGWDVTLVSLHGGEQPAVETTPLVDGPTRLSGLAPVVVFRLARRFRRERPEVVFANGGATLRYVVAASIFTRRRPRLVYGSIGEPGFWLRGPWHRRLQRALIAACDHVVAVSEATGRALVTGLGVPDDKVSVVHPGVAGKWFEVPDRGRRQGPLRVLYAGSLSYEKAPEVAVAAVQRLQGDAVLRLVGDGPLRQVMEEMAGSETEVVGAVADLAREMSWADVLILPSLTEGLPGVAVEAAASGIPVVASDVGGVSEIVSDGVTGFLLAPGDVDGFAEALGRLAADGPLRAELGAAGRKQTWEGFRLSESIDGYETVFRRVSSR